MSVFEQSGCYRAKVVVITQSCCIPEKGVMFGKKWLFSGRSGCIVANVVVFGKS